MHVEHCLKTWPEYFQAVWDGDKTAEIRKNDRGFQVGDTVVLEEWRDGAYTGRIIRARISHITEAPWLPDGMAMLSLADAMRAETPTAPAEPVSRAAALLRAVEGLEAGWLRRSIINSVEAASAGGRVEVDAWEYLGARMGRGSGEGASFADALIALHAQIGAGDA